MNNLPHNSLLVFDIETTSKKVDEAELRVFAAYSYLTNKRYYLVGEQLDVIKELINMHKAFIGFNIKRYDIPVLNKYGLYFQYKTLIDLWEIISPPRLDMKTRVRTGGKGRGDYMGLKLDSYSLANIVKALKLGELKGNIDYDLIKKPVSEWTKEEARLIEEYTQQDITITKDLFEHTNNFYFPFTEFLSKKNVMNFTYLTASIASLSYKIICNMAGLDETYGEGIKDYEYEGGYVKEPVQETVNGTVLIYDFASLYPSIMRGFNLFSSETVENRLARQHGLQHRPIFHDNEMFQLKGNYFSDEQGRIETVIEKLYDMRVEYKKVKDVREYLIKIIINSAYGIMCNPAFAQVYTRHSGEDCTYIGRTMTKFCARDGPGCS